MKTRGTAADVGRRRDRAAARRGGVVAIAAAVLGLHLAVAFASAAEDERVQITATDGVQLVGHLYGTGGPGIVLGHMYPADQRSWMPVAEELARAGYRALTFDFRGYGESGGTKDIAAIDRDMEGAYRYLVGRKIQPIVLAGASMGGTAALIVASRVPVAAVVTLSAPLAFQGLDATDAVKRVQAPKLFIASQVDEPAAAAVARFLALAPEPKETRLFPGAAHGTDLFSGPHADEVRHVMRTFIAAYAKPDATSRGVAPETSAAGGGS
jgi:pimeloyl-ACP methyl ester carboxylesterase